MTVNIIRKLQATNSRTDKEQILYDAWMSGERALFAGARLAYDILMPFRVKKVAEIEGLETTSVHVFDKSTTVDWTQFAALANDLHTRKITGSAAKAAIDQLALKCDGPTWNEFYRRVLLKDLRAGVTDTTFNKVLEKLQKSDKDAAQYIIPVFSCQLAKDGADEANTKHLHGKKMLDVKLDGVRLLTICDVDAGTVTQYTRNGKLNENFPHIRAHFEALLPSMEKSKVFDGEVVAQSFQELMTQVNTKKSASGDTKLALFDVVDLDDFKRGKSTKKQKDRHTELIADDLRVLLFVASGGTVYVVPKMTVDLDTKEGQAAFKEFNREAVDAKFEGIMVKDPESYYETKRSTAWLKIKPFIEVSLTIKGYEEGTGKNAGKLGAWIMEGEDEGRDIKVNCGGGFSDKEREDFWKKRDAMLGFIGEVRADALTLEQGETVYSLRFPRWKGLRGTEPGEKL